MIGLELASSATAYLKQLIQEHPEATDEEIWELFRPAATNNDKIKAVREVHIRQCN
jgi:hypothetical protein